MRGWAVLLAALVLAGCEEAPTFEGDPSLGTFVLTAVVPNHLLTTGSRASVRSMGELPTSVGPVLLVVNGQPFAQLPAGYRGQPQGEDFDFPPLPSEGWFDLEVHATDVALGRLKRAVNYGAPTVDPGGSLQLSLLESNLDRPRHAEDRSRCSRSARVFATFTGVGERLAFSLSNTEFSVARNDCTGTLVNQCSLTLCLERQQPGPATAVLSVTLSSGARAQTLLSAEVLPAVPGVDPSFAPMNLEQLGFPRVRATDEGVSVLGSVLGDVLVLGDGGVVSLEGDAGPMLDLAPDGRGRLVGLGAKLVEFDSLGHRLSVGGLLPTQGVPRLWVSAFDDVLVVNDFAMSVWARADAGLRWVQSTGVPAAQVQAGFFDRASPGSFSLLTRALESPAATLRVFDVRDGGTLDAMTWNERADAAPALDGGAWVAFAFHVDLREGGVQTRESAYDHLTWNVIATDARGRVLLADDQFVYRYAGPTLERTWPLERVRGLWCPTQGACFAGNELLWRLAE